MKPGYALALSGMVETLAISWPTVVDAVRHRVSVDVCDERLARWSRRLLEQADVRLEVRDREPVEEALRAHETFILMSNHRSLYDVPVLFQAFPGTLRMVAKTELFRVPIWGKAMQAAGFIEVDRKNRARAIASLKAARDTLDGGVNVWIAPEGTRSRDGSLGPFKKGGFMLALETGRRILPIGLLGTEQILPARASEIRRGARVEARFGAPIDPRTFGEARRDELTAAVRAAIVELVGS